MAQPESDRLTPEDGDSIRNREGEEYDYELVAPVAVGADTSDAESVNADARLTLPGPDGERVTLVGDADDLRRRLDKILAWESGETADERRERVDEYPMPDPDDLETVPADEFYSDARDG